MSEIDSLPENLKIPENWDFLEKNNPGLKVVHLDLDERFLAFTLPDNPSAKEDGNWYIADYGDYFFSEAGKPSLSRKCTTTLQPGTARETDIRLKGDSEVFIHLK